MGSGISAQPPAGGDATEAAADHSRRPAPEFDTFFAVSLDLLVIRDAQFRFVKVNEAWETVLGYRVDELEGQPMLSFIHPDDVPSSHGEMRRMEVEDEVKGFINRYRCKDGSYRHLEWRARRVGELVYGVARDVTERLAVEAAMATAKSAAEAANRAKSDFLANMSHEIRTPLNGVLGVVTALAKTKLDEAQREMVELIASSSETLERIVSDVLDISKIEAGQLEIERRPFDLRAELESMLELFQLRAGEKGLGFRIEWGEAARGEFLGDSVRLKQVVANLVSNAIKFTEKGEVAVRLELEEKADPPVLKLDVRDTGVGFDDASVEKLFQRFSQADASITRRFGGSGLGLAISRALVEAMGGALGARSTRGEGSVFFVEAPLPRSKTLAAYDAGRSGPQAAPAEEGEAALAGLRVLLAEDHPINRRVVELILQPLGVALTSVEDGERAVRAFEPGRFDLVLMDMQMPVLDGLSATRAIRGVEAASPDRPRTPIVMLSANAMRQHSIEAAAAGADLHLPKPVTAAGLLRAVEAVLAGAQASPASGETTSSAMKR